MINPRSGIWRAGLILALGALWSAHGVSAQTPPVFTVTSPDPIVAHGVGGAWDDPYTDPGAVFYYDGQFHMFRNGFQAWPAAVQWGYVTSPDGTTWTKQGDQPVFGTAQVPYAGVAALASSGLVQADGTWVLYFYTYGDGGDTKGNWAIGRATAPGPTGPWTADPAPVLQPGPAGAWDPKLSSPSVIQTPDGYVMYFDGGEPTGVTQIGRATSPDGIHWSKYNDPATGGAFAQSDPVFSASSDAAAWDRLAVDHPRVVRAPQGWVMLYRATQRTAGSQGLGYAVSDDGLHWQRAGTSAALTWRLIPDGDGLYYCDLVYQGGTFFVMWEVTKGNSSQIYLATHSGALPFDTPAAPAAASSTSQPALPPTGQPDALPPVVGALAALALLLAGGRLRSRARRPPA